MSDRSFGDHAFRNVVKNPLLSTSVTGLSIEDLTHNAVLLPAVPTQEMSTRRDEREEAKPCTLAYSEHEVANLPSGDTNFNIYPPNTFKNIDPNPANIQNVTKNVSTKEISTSNVSKASVKPDDDFDVNEYIARLQGTRYVSAPLNTILKEEQNANLQGSEENLEEINLNEPEKVQNQDHVPQSITADIAQNFSQLPTVLPQMASVVFNSFSNMLSMKSREQTPDDANKAHDGGYGLPEVRKAGNDGNYGQAETSVPVMGVPDMVKDIALAPPLKEPPPVGTANYRITTRKKVYAQIPGLSTREMAQNIPTYNQSPIAQTVQLPHFVPDVNAYGSTSTSNDNERTTEIKTSFDAVDFNAITSGNVGEVKSSVYDIFAPTNKSYDAANQAFPYMDTVSGDTLKIDAKSSEDLSKFEQVNHIQSQFLQSTQQISQPLVQEASAPPVNIAQGSSTVIPPPPMFSNLPKKDSQAPVGKTVLPPSVARRIAANQPILKSQPASVMPQYDHIFIPQNLPETVQNTPMLSSLNESQVMSSTVSNSEMRPATVNLQEKATTFKPVDTSQITPFSWANSAAEVLHHSSELPQTLNAEAIQTQSNEGAKIPSTGAHILLQTTLGISHSLDVNPETLYSMKNTSHVLPSSTTTNIHQQRATSDTVNITPPSFFNPPSVQTQENNNFTDKPGISELNAAQFFSPKAAPPAPTTSVPDPPRISGTTNYRMTKRKPQYYSGPIEGVGSISNNIKPILNPIHSDSFKGALFTPSETMQPHTESLPSYPDNFLVGQIPFDNFTQQDVPPSNDHCNPILNLTAQEQFQTNYNTVYDLSRPASDRFEPPQQEAIGFGIIGSLKSKLSSIDIGKIQNTVTTFFDPAYNDIKTPMTNAQGNQPFEPYYHNTGTASKSQLQGQTACLDMFVVPNVEPIHSKAHDVGFQATEQNENIYAVGNQSTYAQTFQNDPTEQGRRLNPHMEYYKEHGDTTSSLGAFDSETYTLNSFNINRPPTVGNIKNEDNKNNESHSQILFGLGSNAGSSLTPKESTSEPPNEAQRRKAYDDLINQSLKNLVEDVCVIEPSESDSTTNIQESHSINTVHNNDNITQYFSSESCNDNVLKGDNNSKNIIGGSTSESSKIYQPQSMSDNVPRLAGRVKSVSIYKSEQEQATSNVCDWFDRSCETLSTSILQNQQENKEGEVNNVKQFIVFSSGEPLIETPQRIVYDHPINEMNIPEKDINVIEPQCTYAPSESNFDYGYNSDYVAQYYSAHTVHSSMPYSDNVLKYTDSSKNTLSEVKNSVPVLPPRIKSITVYKDSQNETTTTSNWIDQAAGNSFSPSQQANTGLTNLIEAKTDVKEINDVTKQLIENIIAPIQLSNPVEVPLTETNVIVDNDPEYCPGQLAEISHITEETIATLQVQSATKLLQDSNVDDTIRKCYGWRAEEAVIPRALGDHIYSIKPDPNSIGLLQNTFFDNVLTNASDELKAECKDSLDDHVVLPRQMSIPTAPPAEEDSKSDEGVLDVLSIEQDAIGNDFVIEQETDDRKMMVRERTSDEQDQEDDTFTNRVEKYKQLEETTTEEIKDGYTKPLNKPFPSYLDTGNFAAENHYKNSAHPGLIPYTLPIMRIPPGFEQEYYKRISLSNQNYLQPETYVDENISSILENELGNIIGCIENENENVPQIPDTTTQTRITPTVTICQALLSDTVVTSSSILRQISYSSTENDDNEQVLHGKNIYQDSNKETSRSPVDDIDHQSVLSSKNIEESTKEQYSLENTDSLSRLSPSLSNLRANSSYVIKGASDVEDTRQNRLSTSEVVNNDNMLPGAFNLFNSPYSHEVITASSSIDRPLKSPTNVTESPAPINASAVKLENDGNSHSALMRQTNNNETSLPDPASFFSIESTSTTISKNVDVDEEEQYNFSRLSSYFSAPPATKADHSKSFFELSQSQNHYRQNQPAQNSSQSLQQSVTSFFGSNTSNIQLQEKTIHGDTQNVTELNNYLTNLNLVRELASTKNFIPQNVVTTANYFTVHYDIGNSFHSTVGEPNCLDVSEHFSHSSSNKKNDLDKSTQLGELGETETIDDTYIINNCKHCCDMTSGKIVKIDINSVVTNDKVNHVMDSDTENKSGDTETNMMEESKDIKKKTGHTVNFDTSSLQEDPNEAVSMISESRPTSEYSPVKFHWFYRIDVEGKSVWRGFSMTDSRALERSFNSPDLNENTVVATDGGRFDVNVVGRLRIAVYWPDKPTNVRRCSWFYKGTTDARYVPYTESVAEKLEEEYRHGMTTGEWHRRLMLPNNEMVVMHGPAVMVHFLQTTNDAFNSSPLFSFGKRVYRNPPKITVSQDQTGKIDHLILLVHGAGEYRNQKEKAKVQSMMRPRVVRRGCAESEIEESEPSSIDHLLLLCHGVGSACDMRFRAVEEVVDDFRATSLQLLQSHYRNSYDNGMVGRIEVLPISWHASLHSCETGVDRRLGAVTLDSIPRLRSFTNDTILDVLFYTSPPYCQYILDTVCKELNRIYRLFKTRNPDFRGGVSLGGHSLGSVILYDLLCNQAPLKEPKLLPRSAEKQLVEGCASAGQPALNYPQLEFEPAALYALGSPIAIFECIRGVEVLGKDFCLPNCKKFFNVFHPYDPIAYRLEPMVNPELRDVKPQLIPHHKGRKRMHLELKDTMARVGADIKQKIIESIRSTWTSMWKSDAPPDTHLEKVVEEEIEKELEEERKDDIIEAMAQATPEMLGRLNGGRRVDYVLQEAPFEMINEYLFAMRSHVCYWESEDTMLLILREIYDSLGVQPDCSVPQPGMTVQRTRTVPADEVIVTSTDSPSTSRGSS